MRWCPINSCLMCPMVSIVREEYVTIYCNGEDPTDPRVVSCDMYNCHTPKWCPLITTDQLVKLILEEKEIFLDSLKDEKK